MTEKEELIIKAIWGSSKKLNRSHHESAALSQRANANDSKKKSGIS